MKSKAHSEAVERAITKLMQLAAQKSADKCQMLDEFRVVVTSGTSGNQYIVDLFDGTCTCAAGSFRQFCRHRVAAKGFMDGICNAAPSVVPKPAPMPAPVAHEVYKMRDRFGRTEVIYDGFTI